MTETMVDAGACHDVHERTVTRYVHKCSMSRRDIEKNTSSAGNFIIAVVRTFVLYMPGLSGPNSARAELPVLQR